MILLLIRSGSDLEDTVDIDLEDDLKDGLASLHGRDRSKGELSEGGVVVAANTLTLEDRELNGLLVVSGSISNYGIVFPSW